MSYGLIGLRKSMEGQAKSGLQDLAQQQSAAKLHEEQAEQAHKAQVMGAVGTGAGIGLMGGPVGGLLGAGIGWLLAEADSIF